MKKILTFATALAMSLCLFGCSSSDGSAESEAAGTEPEVAEEAITEEPPAANSDFVVEIGEGTVVQDYEGNPALAVNYTWTNNSDEATSFAVAIYAQAFQNGVQLDPAIAIDVDSGSTMNEIKPGATQSVTQVYALSDSSEVLVECSELVSFDDTIIATKTFSVA